MKFFENFCFLKSTRFLSALFIIDAYVHGLMLTWIKKSWTASSGGLLKTDSCQSYVYKSLLFFPPQDFGRLIFPTSTRRVRLCPTHYYWHPRIFRPSYGPARYGVESGQFFGHCARSMKFESCKKNATITRVAESGEWGWALCVQMDFMRTFQTNTKCNNLNHIHV